MRPTTRSFRVFGFAIRDRAIRGFAVAGIAIALMLMVPRSTFAHHGFDMFDLKKTVTLKGTVKDFQWTNPHTWIQLNVEENGTVTEWSLEGESITALSRRGWKRGAVHAGQVVSVDVHPLRNGKPGGQWVAVRDAGGQSLGESPYADKK